MVWRDLLCAAALALLGCMAGAQATLQPVPALTGRVIDQAATLDASQRAALEQKLETFEHEAGPQIVVLIVPATAPEDIADYTQRVADAWKIGRREVGDGVLLVVAKNERRVRIAPAKALEGAIPDLAARQIIDRAIVPAFRTGDYAGGLNAGLDQLIARIRGEHLPVPSQPGTPRPSSQGGTDWGQLMMFFFIGVPILGAMLTGMLGRKLGGLTTAGGAGAAAWWLSSSTLLGVAAGLVALVLVGVLGVGARRSRGGFGGMVPPIIWGGGGGGGGGGFSSGGGGDFGGGGASGSW